MDRNIILNSEIKETFEDEIFEERVHFVQGVGKSNEIIKMTFIRCQFLKGISFDTVDISQFAIEQILVQFVDCFITKRLWIRYFEKRDNQLFTIRAINSLIDEFDILASKISAIQISRTILSHRFSFANSKVDMVSIDNSLGSFMLNDDGHCQFSLHYSDNNLFVERSPVLRLWKKLKEHKRVENILYLPTTYKLRDLRKIQIIFDEKSKLEGYHLVHTYNNMGEEIKRKKYFLTKDDLLKMKISVDIETKKSVTESIFINSAILQRLYIVGESASTVRLEHLQVDNVYFDEFRSKSFQMYDIKPRNSFETIFQVLNSNFIDANFVKVYFNRFKKVNFYRSYFEQAKFSASSFPNEILSVKNVHYFDKKEDDYQWIQYELFRQLKTSLLSNNNQLLALEMHSKMYNALRSAKGLKWQDKFILFLNRLSNNHATSISRAFFLSIILLAVLWVFYCANLPNAPYKLGWYGWEEFTNGVSSFFGFVYCNLKTLFVLANPVHSINDLNKLIGEKMELTKMNYFISFVSRIVMAWLFYQFVSAFRKFGKTQ